MSVACKNCKFHRARWIEEYWSHECSHPELRKPERYHPVDGRLLDEGYPLCSIVNKNLDCKLFEVGEEKPATPLSQRIWEWIFGPEQVENGV